MFYKPRSMTIFGSARKDTPALGVEYSWVYLGKQAEST